MFNFASARAGLVLGCIAVFMVGLIGRVGYLQTYGREQTILQAERQQHLTQVLRARRGSIFTRDGNKIAGTVQKSTLFIDPKYVLEHFQSEGRSLVQMDEAIDQLARILDLDPFELSMKISERHDTRYLKIAEALDDEVVEAVSQIDLPGMGFLPINVRYYPMGSIGAHLMGGVGKDDQGDFNKGLEGLELRFNALLSGKDGYKRATKDARRREIAVAAEDYLPPIHGRHLVLTIDSNIQMFAEQELAKVCEEFKAKRGEVIVMDPQTGDLLAMACWPTFHPQNLEDSTPDQRRNRNLTDPYEPGSTIKTYIVGSALGERLTRLNEVWPINGPSYRTAYGRRITDVHGYDRLSTWDVLVKSSNIGMGLLAERMGNAKLHAALSRFGFGRRTGIDLPGEDPGLVNPLRSWSRYSTHSVAQGYELMVTPLQITRAFCAYANGGRLVTPRLVKGVLDPDGQVVARDDAPPVTLFPQVIDRQTSLEVRRILADVPVRGTAQKARSMRWNLFGKTGTAHSARNGSYNESNYTSSFVGGAPLENPRVVIGMIIHDPDRSVAHYGGTVSAPGAARVIERTLAYLQEPDSPELLPPPAHISNTLYGFEPGRYKRPSDRAERAQRPR